MRRILLSCLFGAAVGASGFSAFAQSASPRSEATNVIRELRRIVAPQGVERNEIQNIGGIKQFISIRGQDRRNPVLLILHGGPGFPTAPMAWWATRPLEEYFTVVHWDQRGSGKTYQLNDPGAVGATMRPGQFVADTEQLVSWLRMELKKDKIFLLGTSWGSYIGLEFARKKPEWLHAYIGMGQATNTPESERRGFAFALQAARQAGNTQAIADLESIAPYAERDKAIPLKDIALERKWSDFFGGVMAYRPKQIDWMAARLSPDYTDVEFEKVFDGNNYSQEYLFSDVLTLDLSHIDKLDCPLLVFAGRHDRTVNSTVAHEWFETVKAPQKHFVWFEHSAHEIMTEEPGKLLISLVQMARPFAEKTGDVAPQ